MRPDPPKWIPSFRMPHQNPVRNSLTCVSEVPKVQGSLTLSPSHYLTSSKEGRS